MFSEGQGLTCPRCLKLTDTPGEDDACARDNSELQALEQKLEESQSKLETTVMVRNSITRSVPL